MSLGIIPTLFSCESLLMESITLATAVYAIVLKLFFREIKTKRELKKKNFFKVLFNGLKNNSIESLDDIINLYKGISGLDSEDSNFRNGLSKYLREFIVEIISKNTNYSLYGHAEKALLDDETIVKWKRIITDFIETNEKIYPYADLPPAERNILNDISVFVENNDNISTQRKISELAGMIQVRNDDLNKIREMNKWSVPLAIIGLILTVISTVAAFLK